MLNKFPIFISLCFGYIADNEIANKKLIINIYRSSIQKQISKVQDTSERSFKNTGITISLDTGLRRYDVK
jgi:hypothetical protein